jgi:hypothetical protein
LTYAFESKHSFILTANPQGKLTRQAAESQPRFQKNQLNPPGWYFLKTKIKYQISKSKQKQ